MSDELLNGVVSVSVPDADGVMHEMTLTIGEPITEAPDPEPQMGGEGEQVDADERTVFEVVNDMTERVANIVSAALEETAAPTDQPSPPKLRSDSMMTPDELAEYDSETVRLVSSQESQVCQLEAELADIKSQTKAAKKAVEDAKESLRELIQIRDRQRGRKPTPTLFDAPAHNATATTTNRVDEGNATDQVDPHAELWREYPLTVDNWKPFGLTAKDVERLNSGETKNSGVHPITKLGDVTRFITPNPDSPAFARTLKDFKGFGDAAYDRWLNAETQFWDWWNNKGGKETFADEQKNGVNLA